MKPGERVPLVDRIRRLSRLDENGCWIWTSKIQHSGYGQIEIRTGIGRQTKVLAAAHRVAYEAFRGPIPDGLHVDHLCRVHACVNPDHLEPVTCQVNVLRGTAPAAVNARKTHCLRGHPLSGPNLRINLTGARECRECLRIRGAEKKKRRAAKAAAK